MPRYCIICKEPQSTAFSVFSFPSSIHVKETWIRAIKEANPDFAINQGDKRLKNGICQRHFTKEEVNGKKKKRIKGRTIPSIDLKILSNSKAGPSPECNTISIESDRFKSQEAPCLKAPYQLISPVNADLSKKEGFVNQSTQTEEDTACIEFHISESGSWESSRSFLSISEQNGIGKLHYSEHEKKWEPTENTVSNSCSLCLRVENAQLYKLSNMFIQKFHTKLQEFFPKSIIDRKHFVLYNARMCMTCVLLCDELQELMIQLDTKMHNLESKLRCSNFCNSNFGTVSAGKEGSSSKHISTRSHKPSKTKQFPCSVCSQAFSSPALLAEHLEFHERKTPLKELKTKNFSSKILSKKGNKCLLCMKSFSSPQEITDHMKTHPNSSDCSICGRHLTTKGRLNSHLYKFHKIGEPRLKPYNCSHCAKKFTTKAGLTYHEQVQHKRENKYSCKICHKVFYSSLLYKSHMIYSHGNKSIVCEICGKMFFTVAKLNIHNNEVHRNAKSWTCKHCGEKFNSTWAYSNHISVKHRKILFSCMHCNAFFTRRNLLTTHLWKHGLFFCLTCNRKFNSANSYCNHMLEIHKRDISKKIRNIKIASVKKTEDNSSNCRSNYFITSKNTAQLNDVLISESAFTNPNLSCTAIDSKSKQSARQIQEKSLDQIEATQEFTSEVDDLSLCNLKDDDLKLDSNSNHHQIALEDDVVLLDAPILESIDAFELKDDHENETVSLNQVFNEDLSTEINPSKDSNSESISRCLTVPFDSSNPTNPNIDLSFEELNPVEASSGVATHIISTLESTNRLRSLPVILPNSSRSDWNLASHYQHEKEPEIQTVIHTLKVEDEEAKIQDGIQLLSKDENIELHNSSDAGLDLKINKPENPTLPAFSLDINDRDRVHYKYVMLVNSHEEKTD